jgi:hypothetical protein
VTGLERHAADIAVLAAAALVVAFRPRLAPFLAVLGVLFQSSATHVMTSDGLVLAGAAAGLALDRVRRSHWPALSDVPAALPVLLALNVLMLASLLANAAGPAGSVAAQSTTYFISRSVLVGTVMVLAPRPGGWQWDWIWAGGLGALLVGLARLLELAGVPVSALAGSLSISLLGDVRDVGSWNGFAIALVVGTLLALIAAIGRPQPRAATAFWLGVALVALLAGATAQSRTVTVIVVLLLPILALVATSRGQRAAIAGLGLAFLAVAVTPAASILDKPLVVQASRSPDTAVTGTSIPPASQIPPAARSAAGTVAPSFTAPSTPPVDWRSLLNRPYYRIEQVFTRPTVYDHGNYLAILVRSGAYRTDVQLRVDVGGRTVAVVSADRIGSSYQWIVVPIPDGLLTSVGDVDVGLSASGALDSTTHYISVGGTDAFAPDVVSHAYSAGRPVTDDLSADPGVQRGTFLVFLDGRVPALSRFRAGSQTVLDPSLSDRLTLWGNGWRIFRANPVVGTGYYTFGSIQDRYATTALFFQYDNAHSNYVELLADLGVLGPLLLLLFMGTVAVPLLVDARRADGERRWLDLALAATIAVMVVASVTQTWMADSRIALFFWLVLLASSPSAAASLRVLDSPPWARSGGAATAPAEARSGWRRLRAAAAGSWRRRLRPGRLP